MKRLSTYGLVLAVPLMGLLGFYPFIHSSKKRVLVTIFDNCTVLTQNSTCKAGTDPETTCAAIGDTVIWTATDTNHSYSAVFPNSAIAPFAPKTPFHGSDYLGPAIPSVSAGPSGQGVTGDENCNPNKMSVCDFPYDVYRQSADGESYKCGDPGIHVVPTTDMSFLSWLRSWWVAHFG